MRNIKLIAVALLIGIGETTLAQTIGPPVFAGIFGARQIEYANPNDPGTNYSMVHHGGGHLPYEQLRGWGFEVLHYEPYSRYGSRSGYGQFGPFDESVNLREEFSTNLPDQIYNSFIGAKNFSTACSSGTPEAPEVCHPPEGIVFRIDVPNGWYRFVGVFGDADNPHAHRVLAEDGGMGLPENIGENYVTLVSNHDQSQFDTGDAPGTTRSLGAGVFARVGFGRFLPPRPSVSQGPRPVFVNMDENGLPTEDDSMSPILRVTAGYIRIHLLQGDSNDGIGGHRPDPATGVGNGDPGGTDIVLLEVHPVSPVGTLSIQPVDSATTAVTWPVIPNTSYVVEKSTDGLVQWTPITGSLTPGPLDILYTAEDPEATNTHGAYRVRTAP